MKYAYLVCGRLDREQMTRGCGMAHIPIEEVQDWLIERLEEYRLDGIAPFLQRLEAAEARQREQSDSRRQAIATELKRLEGRIERAEQGYLDGLWGPDRVLGIKDSLLDQIQALRLEAGALTHEAKRTDIHELRRFFEVEDWLDSRFDNPAGFRDAIRMILDRVVVTDRGSYELVLQEGLKVEIG